MLTSGTPWFYGRSSGRALGGAAVTLCTALLAAAPAAAQSLTYGPLLGRGHTPDQSIVRWGTGAATDATSVAYRKKGAAMWQLQSGGAARDHEVILTGLAPGETYELGAWDGMQREEVVDPARGVCLREYPAPPGRYRFHFDNPHNLIPECQRALFRVPVESDGGVPVIELRCTPHPDGAVADEG